ncbi:MULTISPECIES: DUF3429 domain-containing protein [unclassified Arsukibacterium]|uniref:DUF3429 domain-containing protein n=1 Tax=unclassified Arsukibacterium TaxID=2635278 RepID=UPI000C67FF10|nr:MULTISPECIES: DUF3429 domain-containing protein [unclassified Arsukibacterium]MAA95188.1 hypothetical protein [Rheinheimera sp.]MBM35137.1 hypothetical protein [Rheinheimera sp.]HAW93508.1 DUF3429 domain-containing protein [Candidatus Azambacteria bacterium]|tara:strand:+ start:624 stop:1064 length:441 start_codon:yes stop_codon:yes gene_type:complete
MKLINILGFAGLLPFVLLPLAYHMQWLAPGAQLLQLYQLFSALILGFMAGVLWPVLYQPAGKPSGPGKLALLAVSFPVISIICLALLPDYFLLLQALLFLLLRLAEFSSGINQRYSKNYQSLRNALTVVVAVSHIVMFALLGLSAT